MRTPPHFRPTDPREAWDIIARPELATLVTAPGGVPVATPLACIGRPDEGAHGALLGHLARDNEQLEHLRAGSPTLVIFQGVAAYVSGSWYAEQPAVPTVNHVTVHVSGTPEVLDDEARTLAVLTETVRHFEASTGSAWRLDSGHEIVPSLAAAVVAFRIEVTRLEAQFKLSQNLDPSERRRVAAGLLRSGAGTVVAAMARERDLCHDLP